MNYVRRNEFVKPTASVLNGAAAGEFLRAPAPERRWPISYSSVETAAIASDIIVILLSGILSGIVYQIIGNAGEVAHYIGSAAIVSALFIILMKNRGLYNPAELLSLKAQIRSIAVIWIGVFLFLAGVVFALKIGKEFSRGAVLTFAAVGMGALIVQRLFWRSLLRRGLAEHKFSGRNIVLITDGAAPSEQDLIGSLASHGFQLKHHFALPDHEHGLRGRDQMISKVLAYLRGSDIQEVVVSADLNRWPEVSSLLSRLRILPLPVVLIPVGPGSEIMRRPSHVVGESICIELHRGPLSTLERMVKRVFDVLCAGMGLIALIPLLVLTAIAIKLDSPGPILFRQRRCGFNGKPFQILKFRTMSVLEDGASVCQAVRSDKRVTRVGKWLRRTSIDELPQLLNVLNGTMSLVGPRPHALAHDNQFDKVISNYAFRHHVKPGLTGWAQVNGCRGATPTVADIQRRVELDLWYVDNWKFSLDCLIILRTVFEVMRSENAY